MQKVQHGNWNTTIALVTNEKVVTLKGKYAMQRFLTRHATREYGVNNNLFMWIYAMQTQKLLCSVNQTEFQYQIHPADGEGRSTTILLLRFKQEKIKPRDQQETNEYQADRR